MGIVVGELEREPEGLLRLRYGAEKLSAAVLTALRKEQFVSFEVGFELAARVCEPPADPQSVRWINRYAASGRGVPDAVPWWDVASRQWLLKLAKLAPQLVEAEKSGLSSAHQRLADFCLCISRGIQLPSELGQAVARHYLNAGPDGFAYAGLIALEAISQGAEQLLTQQAFPVLRRERVEELVPYASDGLLLELCANYCGQDFRSFTRSLLKARASIGTTCLEERAKRECSLQGAIALGLHYIHCAKAPVEQLPKWASEALLMDLQSGSDEDVPETLSAMLALQPKYARHLLTQVLRERRAVLMVPALADEELLRQFLARIEEGLVDRATAVAALRRCGTEGLHALLNLGDLKRPAASLASVVAEALSSLVTDNDAVSHRTGAAELLVPWLGHSSKGVVVTARRTLEQLGEAARAALMVGLKHERRAVREESARILDWLSLRQPTNTTPLDVVRDKAAAHASLGASFLKQCHELLDQPERWASSLLPHVRGHGASCVEWLRPWFEQHVQHGDVRLWCYIVELLAQDDEAVWVAVDTFARAPKLPTSLWARPRRTLTRLGPRLAQPVAFVLAHVSTEYREPLFRLLAMHGDQAPLPILLAGLADESKPVRSHAVDALSKLSGSPPPTEEAPVATVSPRTTESADAHSQVVAMLKSSSAGTRIAAAEVLAVWGMPQSRSALLAALQTENRLQVRVYLEEALVAVGGERDVFEQGALICGESAVSDCELISSFLEARAANAKLPRFLLMSPAPELRFRSGGALSDAAQLGFMGLASQLDATLKGRVLRQVATRITPESLAAWSRHVYERWLRSKDIKFKWALYQLWVSADETLIEEVGAEVGTLRANEHATISCYLRVLQWRSSRVALDWLVHWSNALPSRGLRELATTLLGRVGHRSGVTVSALLREADPWVAARYFERQSDVPDANSRQVEIWVRHFEGSLLTGRHWSSADWQRLASRHAALLRGLLWIVEPAVGLGKSTKTPAACRSCVLFDGQTLVDAEGESVRLATDLTLRLAHPLDLSEADVRAWTDRAHALAATPAFEQIHRPCFIYGGESDLVLAALNTDSEQLDKWMKRDRWFHGEPLDHGIVYSNTLRIGAQGLVFRIKHSGYPIGRHELGETVEVLTLEVSDLVGNALDFADVDARTYSELCLSLSRLRPGQRV